MPESYIIHIYRRDTLDPDAVYGLLKGPDLKGDVDFSSIGEVAEILRKTKSGGPSQTGTVREKRRTGGIGRC